MQQLTGLREPMKDLDGQEREERLLNGRGVSITKTNSLGELEEIWQPVVAAKTIANRLLAAVPNRDHPQGWDVMLLDKLARKFYDAGDTLELEDAEFSVAQDVMQNDGFLFPWAKAACLQVFENATTVKKPRRTEERQPAASKNGRR